MRVINATNRECFPLLLPQGYSKFSFKQNVCESCIIPIIVQCSEAMWIAKDKKAQSFLNHLHLSNLGFDLNLLNEVQYLILKSLIFTQFLECTKHLHR